MEEYEYYDLIVDYLLETRRAMTYDIKRNIAAFTDLDEDRINLWLKQMHEIAPDYIGLKRAFGTNVLVPTDYTAIFKKDGGFKALIEQRQRKR